MTKFIIVCYDSSENIWLVQEEEFNAVFDTKEDALQYAKDNINFNYRIVAIGGEE